MDKKDYEEFRAKCDFRYREVTGRQADTLKMVYALEKKVKLLGDFLDLEFRDGLHLVERIE